MDCTEFLARYSDYDDSLVPPAEADRFRGHMDRCSSCARYDRVLRKGRMVARQLSRIEPSDGFMLRLQTRLWRESHAARAGRPAPRLPLAVAAATVLLAGVAALGLMGAPTPAPTRIAFASLRGPAATPAPEPAPMARTRPHRPEPPSLRAIRVATPRGWSAERVDPAAASSYSPLITGMPAYGTTRARPSNPIPAHRRSTD